MEMENINAQDEVTEIAASAEAAEEQPEEKTEEQLRAEAKANVAECIRYYGRNRRPITTARLCEECDLEPEKAQELLTEMKAEETYADLCVYHGQKEDYHYTYPTLAHNYVRSIALSEGNDIQHTIATIVRYDSKTYPRAVPCDNFRYPPYGYTEDQVKEAVAEMKKNPDYEDITVYISQKGTCFLYSTLHLTPVYARRLAEDSEDLSMMY